MVAIPVYEFPLPGELGNKNYAQELGRMPSHMSAFLMAERHHRD